MRDQLPELSRYLPNIDAITVESREEPAPGEVKLLNRWKAASTEVPLVARKFVNPSTLYWLDHAHWFEAEWLCRWRLEMGFMTDRIGCAGTTSFHEKPGGTEVRIRGDLNLDLKGLVPALLARKATATIEAFVVRLLQPNFKKTNDALVRYLESKGE